MSIKNSNIENEKKFINVKLKGENPNTVIAPRRKGTKKTTLNLLLNNFFKRKFLLFI